MEALQQRALETLNADDVSRVILLHFNEHMPLPPGMTFAQVENDPRLTVAHPDAHRAYLAHKAEYIKLLAAANPSWDQQLPPRSILDTAAVDQEKRYVFQVNTIEEIPKQFRSDARALPNGKYRIVGDSTLATAMMGETVTGGEKPVEKPPVADPKLFQIARAAMASGDITAYRELSELAAKQGKVVKIID